MEPPEYLLQVEPLDLGADLKAIGLELVEQEEQAPVRGAGAARIWSAVLRALAATEPWALDFFSHLDRLRDFCQRHGVTYRQAAQRCIVIPAPEAEPLAALLERFEGETFGVRAGTRASAGDAALEGDLARRGADAYHHAYGGYLFCAVCDFENGFLTVLSNQLWATEVLRRARPALAELSVEVARPQ
jgi:hypothetical protein